MKYTLLVLLLGLSCGILHAQESLHPLKNNPVLVREAMKLQAGSRAIIENRDTLCLPFLDDFSDPHIYLNETSPSCLDSIDHISSGVYPASLFWVDSNAFINITYPTLPPTYGVATLDGLNKKGQPYNETSTFGMADVLTSKPVYLSSIVDSAYLSFYYQPGGLGNFPEPNDSLILEFKNSTGGWDHIWAKVNTLGDDIQSFKLVILPIDGAYQYDGFQFRFRNWASINGNHDHWHLDDILLNDSRTFDDTLFRDVAIIYEPEPYLKNYRQMPWAQFKDHQGEELNDQHGVFMTNNYNTIVNTSYQYEAFEKYTGDPIVPLTSPISINFDPFSTQLTSYSTFNIPSDIENYDNDSMIFSLKYILNPAGDINHRNDTLLFDQKFYNYYAYDDGTAEKVYALIGTGSKLAIRFFANEPDTLKEVYIHWAYDEGPKSNLFFSLMVWDAIDTTLATASENIIFQNDFLSPRYVDSINGFYVYKLVDFLGNPTPVVVDGYFYVGWLQSQEEYLNVGFDENSDAQDNVFYNTGGAWQKSNFPGAIMIRPQVGGDYSLYSGIQQPVNGIQEINVYPNPVSNILSIDLNRSGSKIKYQIYDQAGRMIDSKNSITNQIDVAALPSGFYILKLQDEQTGELFVSKFVKE